MGIYPFIKSQEKWTDDRYYPDLGIYLAKSQKQLNFKENEAEVYLSRHYESNCEKIIGSSILGIHHCSDSYSNKRKADVAEAIRQECETIWNRQTDIIKNLTMANDLEAIKDAQKEYYKDKRSAGDDPVHHRQKRLALETIGLFATIGAQFVSIFSSLYAMISERKLRQADTELYYKGSKSAITVANIARNLNLDQFDLRSMLSSNYMLLWFFTKI